jgi:hypothetical protein
MLVVLEDKAAREAREATLEVALAGIRATLDTNRTCQAEVEVEDGEDSAEVVDVVEGGDHCHCNRNNMDFVDLRIGETWRWGLLPIGLGR